LGEVLTTPHCKKFHVPKHHTRPRTWANSLVIQPKQWKREVGWRGMDWIELAEDRDRWQALVNAVMNLQVP
jgi:hypothetical protein